MSANTYDPATLAVTRPALRKMDAIAVQVGLLGNDTQDLSTEVDDAWRALDFAMVGLQNLLKEIHRKAGGKA